MNEIYGYWDKKTKLIYGEGHFELSSAPEKIYPLYTTPRYEGQEPCGCVGSAGMLLFYPEHLGKSDELKPVYLEKENEPTDER
jgi:hypothetical protein